MTKHIYAFKYRLPGATECCGGMSDHCLEQPRGRGFVIAPFLPHSPMIFIPAGQAYEADTFREALRLNGRGLCAPFPEASTTPDQLADEVETIKTLEREGKLTKAVAARCLLQDAPADIDALFDSLCRNYPDAFVYLFTSPESGTWIGASPELLLKHDGTNLHTMALAGTHRDNDTDDWDAKNRKEHDVVTKYIMDCFAASGLAPKAAKPVTKPAGPVEHLMTRISAETPVSALTADTPEGHGMTSMPAALDVLELIDSLAPTPALCGMPRELAAETIAQQEHFERSFFGGYCGPWNGYDSFSLFVTLRCAHIAPDRAVLYAGAGIMPESDPASEWAEIDRKLSTLTSLFPPHIVAEPFPDPPHILAKPFP